MTNEDLKKELTKFTDEQIDTIRIEDDLIFHRNLWNSIKVFSYNNDKNVDTIQIESTDIDNDELEEIVENWFPEQIQWYNNIIEGWWDI